MFNMFGQKIVFSTVIEKRTELLFRTTQVEKIPVRIVWHGGDSFVGIVGSERLDPLLIADYYGLNLKQLAVDYNNNSEVPKVFTEQQAIATRKQVEKDFVLPAAAPIHSKSLDVDSGAM